MSRDSREPRDTLFPVATPKTPDRIGQLVNERYEIREVIGRGGQGLVYHAFDRWIAREVALKVLGSKTAREPHMVERLMREQQALMALKGTAAVELLDVCRGLDGELCLVMELLVGTDLDDHLFLLEQRGERLSLAEVVEIFEPIVSTLETAHAAGILHRDLKPANIFLLETGKVRLLDFGMARLKNAAPLTAAGTIMGSPSFMAPEAWRGISDLVDQRADVYSLGVILFRVLSGDLPFGGDTLKEKFLNSTTRERPSLHQRRPDLPRAVDEWVALALALDREERFGNVRALWNAFLKACRIESQRPGARGSFWAAAKQAMKKLAAPGAAPAQPTARSEASSITRHLLARSAFQVAPPAPLGPVAPPTAPKKPPHPAPSSAPSVNRFEARRAPTLALSVDRQRPDATIELRDEDLLVSSAPPEPPRAVDKTICLTDADLFVEAPPPSLPARAVDASIGLSDAELTSEGTLPDAPAPVAPAGPPPPPSREGGNAGKP